MSGTRIDLVSSGHSHPSPSPTKHAVLGASAQGFTGGWPPVDGAPPVDGTPPVDGLPPEPDGASGAAAPESVGTGEAPPELGSVAPSLCMSGGAKETPELGNDALGGDVELAESPPSAADPENSEPEQPASRSKTTERFITAT